MRSINLAAAWVIAASMSLQPAVASEHPAADSLQLSKELRTLLRNEMREIAKGVQSIPVDLARGKWDAIAQTAAQIRASYVMQQALTPALKDELQHQLPASFKALDQAFHQRAAKLVSAAKARDAELVVFHYARLIESCTGCHSAFAAERFPGLAAPAAPQHDGHH